MKKVILQISDKSGTRIERLTLTSTPLVLGRAWNSDVILLDKFVSPDHLSVSLGDGGSIQLADLASTNGSSVAGKALLSEAIPYRIGELIRVGDTSVRIFDHNSGVESASIRSAWFLLAEKFKHFPALLALTVVALGTVILSNWMFSANSFDRSDALSAVFTTLVMLVVWSLVLGFTGKLIRGESNFRAFWMLACLGIVVFEVVNFLVRTIRFNLQDAEVGYWVSVISYSGVIILVLLGIFTYTSHLSRRYKWIWSTLIVLTAFGLIKSDDLLKEDHERWTDQSRTETATMPGVFLFRDPVSVDQYQRASDELFELADQQNTD